MADTLLGFPLKISNERPDLTNSRKCFAHDGNMVCAAYQLEDGTIYLAGFFDVFDGCAIPTGGSRE